MSRYTITHACGHQEVHQIYGPYKSRPARQDALEQRICPKCQGAEKEAGNTAALGANPAAGLPALTGSPKQICWAETIRAEALADLQTLIEAHCAEAKHRDYSDDQIAETRSRHAAAIAQVTSSQTTAAWRIDHRHPAAIRQEVASRLP